tara:strand:+ start:192 stop:785 length:594 start_codon:yes stop_codon:yes gene_type:complete
MKVSVIVTNYNYEKWLRRCIRSLLNQNFSDYEIIIVDDCSTDNSKSILLDYIDYNNIKIIFNKTNLGVGGSSNAGAKLARGKYMVRVDADDYVHQDFLNCLWLNSSLNNYHSTAVSYQEIDFDENILCIKSQRDHPIACGIMYRSDILEYLGFWDPNLRINEDIDIIERFNKEFKMEYLDIPLYRYFKHDNSLSTNR